MTCFTLSLMSLSHCVCGEGDAELGYSVTQFIRLLSHRIMAKQGKHGASAPLVSLTLFGLLVNMNLFNTGGFFQSYNVIAHHYPTGWENYIVCMYLWGKQTCYWGEVQSTGCVSTSESIRCSPQFTTVLNVMYLSCKGGASQVCDHDRLTRDELL